MDRGIALSSPVLVLTKKYMKKAVLRWSIFFLNLLLPSSLSNGLLHIFFLVSYWATVPELSQFKNSHAKLQQHQPPKPPKPQEHYLLFNLFWDGALSTMVVWHIFFNAKMEWVFCQLVYYQPIVHGLMSNTFDYQPLIKV